MCVPGWAMENCCSYCGMPLSCLLGSSVLVEQGDDINSGHSASSFAHILLPLVVQLRSVLRVGST